MQSAPTFLSVCLLWAVFGVEAAAQRPGEDYQPASGFVIMIDPQQLLADGLKQSWSCVNEPFCHSCYSGRSFTKVNFRVTPQTSLDGAVMRIQLEGTSAGETLAKTGSKQVISDSLTRFNAAQMLVINDQGVSFSAAELNVKTDQTLSRTHTRTVVAGAKVRSQYRQHPDRIQAESNAFARQLVARRLAGGNARIGQQIDRAIGQLLASCPATGGLGWHFSSSNSHVFVAAATVRSIAGPLPTIQAPVAIVVDEQFVEDYLNQILAREILESGKVQNGCLRLKHQIDLPRLQRDHAEPWTASLGPRPVTVRFKNNQLEFQIQIDRIESGSAWLEGLTATFSYQVQRRSNGWILNRGDHVKMSPSSLSVDSLDASHEEFRAEMQERLDQILPSLFPIPNQMNGRQWCSLMPDLLTDRVMVVDGRLVIGLERR